MYLSFLLAAGLTHTAFAQTQPARNIEKILDDELSVDWNNQSFEQIVDGLRDQTHANLVPNWTALATAGITRDTPVTLRLTNVPCHAVLRSLLLTLPIKDDRGLNFVIGDNAVELTTNAELGKSLSTRVYPVGPLLARPVVGKAGTDPIAGRSELLVKILRASLASVGESVELPGRALVIKDDLLAITTSRRGQAQVQKVFSQMADPVRPGIVPTIAAESVRAKRAAEQLKTYPTPAALLAAPASPALNLLLLPGARGGNPGDLDVLIDDAGIIEIGPRTALDRRVVLAAYDLSDLLHRRSLRNKSTPADELPAVMAAIKSAVRPTLWGNPDTAPSWLAAYAGELIVQAPPPVHREIASRLPELYK